MSFLNTFSGQRCIVTVTGHAASLTPNSYWTVYKFQGTGSIVVQNAPAFMDIMVYGGGGGGKSGYYSFLVNDYNANFSYYGAWYRAFAGGGGSGSSWYNGGNAALVNKYTGPTSYGSYLVNPGSYTITVGGGGAGGASNANQNGSNGSTSSFGSVATASGGIGATAASGASVGPRSGGASYDTIAGGGGASYTQSGGQNGNNGTWSYQGTTYYSAYNYGFGSGGTGGSGQFANSSYRPTNGTIQGSGGAGGSGTYAQNYIMANAGVAGTANSGNGGGGSGGNAAAGAGGSGFVWVAVNTNPYAYRLNRFFV